MWIPLLTAGVSLLSLLSAIRKGSDRYSLVEPDREEQVHVEVNSGLGFIALRSSDGRLVTGSGPLPPGEYEVLVSAQGEDLPRLARSLSLGAGERHAVVEIDGEVLVTRLDEGRPVIHDS